MHKSTPGVQEMGDNNIERTNTAIDQDRDTFLPRPSDDPNDPLNFPLWLKVATLIINETYTIILTR
jgi:hypothetical protein